jgi:hypothetical protein
LRGSQASPAAPADKLELKWTKAVASDWDCEIYISLSNAELYFLEFHLNTIFKKVLSSQKTYFDCIKTPTG